MNPRIVATSGPLKGSVLSVPEEVLTIGSNPALADVCLEDDPEVEAEHVCLWIEESGRVRLSNEALDHLTKVNGEDVWHKVLDHGDTIQLGKSTFIYYERDDEPALVSASGKLRFDSNLVLLDFNDDDLQDLIDEIFAYSNTDRAAILFLGPDGDELVAGTYIAVEGDDATAFALNRTLVELAIVDRIPIVRNDTESVVCIPLIANDNVFGVLYLWNPERSALGNIDVRELAEKVKRAAMGLGRIVPVQWSGNGNGRPKERIPITHEMIGESLEMLEVYRRIGKAGPVDSTVMIHGATGTGKELVARGIHANSRRAKYKFLPVNCATLKDALVESLLFGHEKGSFTGAITRQQGFIESAEGGTLFFDEIAELPLTAQAVLLRFLQEGEIYPVGSTRPIKVNVRIIAATHRNLEQMVQEGTFRPDLLYRLKVYSIYLPSLSDRRGDIPALISHFLRKFSGIRQVNGIEREARRILHSHAWPGNVRQLEHAIQYALVNGESETIGVDDLSPELLASQSNESRRLTMKEHVDQTKKRVIEQELELCDRNFEQAAKVLGMSPKYLYDLNGEFKRKSGNGSKS